MNANEVLNNVEEMIREAEQSSVIRKRWRIYDVCDDLGIFDWWADYLSVSQLKKMRSFLKTAIKLGFTGYVCFKVGIAGCSHGMWAHKKESTTGYSPDGACLFHSFRSGDNYWDMRDENNQWMHSKYDDKCDFTLNEIKAELKYRGHQNEGH